jgi:hypothetical protein
VRRLWARLSSEHRKLAKEALVIACLLVVVPALIYFLTLNPIRNKRPLAGANVRLSIAADGGSELSFARVPGRPGTLVGTSNSLIVYESTDAGATWRVGKGPVVPRGTCAYGWPRLLVAPGGREYLGFLAGPLCADKLRPSLYVSSRPGPDAAWSKPVRVVERAWKYGFDDAPDLALDRRSGRLYAIWTRGLGAHSAAVVSSSSADGGRTWAPPREVSPALVHPHLPAIAVGADGTVYAAGIDVRLGIWIARSTDRGRTWSAPRRAAPLRANPAADCGGVSGYVVLPNELKTCAGPNPTLLVRGSRALVVYDDVGVNGTQDVFLSELDESLRPALRARVTPVDRGLTQQYLPAATVDATDGTIWVCWYDTTFDPKAHRSWFTCSASKDGRTWAPPQRAAAVPSLTADVGAIAAAPGLYPSVVADDGAAHAFWADTRTNVEGIYTVGLREQKLFTFR